MNEETYTRFLTLFKGLDRAFGKYIMDDDFVPTEGEKAKGRGVTVREDLLPEHYIDHLSGGEMLGVVPIQDGNNVSFSAIDIDDYNLDIPSVLNRVADMRLPLVATRSKSGGLHLWLFFRVPVPAKAAQQKLTEIAVALGFPGVEVFPKQHRINPTDVGNWINLPWYDAQETDRYGWDLEGNEIRDLEAWLDYAEERRISLRDLNRIHIRQEHAEQERPFHDGPPCLQIMAERGVPEGTRDDVMLNVGIYAHAKFEDNADRVAYMLDINHKHFDPSLSDRQTEDKHRQVESNDYRYFCAREPFASNCNRALCLQRRFGCHLNGEGFDFGTLWQHIPVTLEGEPMVHESHWRLQVNIGDEHFMLDLTRDELLTFRNVRSKCVDHGHMIPRHDVDQWEGIVTAKIQNREIVHEPEAASHIGQLRALISDFLNIVGVGTETKQEVLHGKAYLAEDGEYWFKSEVFTAYLAQQRFTAYTGTRLTTVLRERFRFRTDVRRRIGTLPERLWTCPEGLRISGGTDAPEHASDF